ARLSGLANRWNFWSEPLHDAAGSVPGTDGSRQSVSDTHVGGSFCRQSPAPLTPGTGLQKPPAVSRQAVGFPGSQGRMRSLMQPPGGTTQVPGAHSLSVTHARAVVVHTPALAAARMRAPATPDPAGCASCRRFTVMTRRSSASPSLLRSVPPGAGQPASASLPRPSSHSKLRNVTVSLPTRY